jgi:hypothetical protein
MPSVSLLVANFLRRTMEKNTTLAGFTPYTAVIAEMDNDGSGELVTVDQELLKGIVDPSDTKPMFVTIEVLSEGVSRNGRKWTKELIASVAEQVNSKKVDGYRGHLAEDERSHKAPDAETIWLGATVKEVNGKVRLFAKGYVLPYAKKLRSYLRSAKVAGKNVAVSVYGTAKQVVKDAEGYLSMANFNLESIDWARPGSEGVPNSGVFMITAEMVGSELKEGDVMDKAEVLKAANVSELKESNPQVVSEIANEAIAAKDAEYSAVVSEMEEIKAVTGDEPVTVIKEMKSQLAELQLDNELREKVQSPAARKVIKQLVVGEMTEDATVSETVDKVLASDEGKAVVMETLTTEPQVTPGIQAPVARAERRFTIKR